MSDPSLLSRFQGCLMGVRLGDAMGMPWETMSRKQIQRFTNGDGVTGFCSPQQYSSLETIRLTAGDTTDDWQLTEAVAESLIRTQRFDVEDMAHAHVNAYNQSTSGWGKTTRNAMEEFKQWFETDGQRGRAPHEPADNFSRGNGIAMKIAPLALFHLGRAQRFLDKEVCTLGCMTHGDSLAWITALALARIIHGMSWHSECDLVRLSAQIRQTEHIYLGNRFVKDVFSSRLSDLSRASLKNAVIDDVILVTGSGFDAVESVSLAIACATRHLDDSRAGLLEAVNCGGDTDTNAAMTGAILGAHNGIEAWPQEWCHFRPEYATTLDLGKRLLYAAQSASR